MEQLTNHFNEVLVAEFYRRVVDESIPRIKKCLLELADEEIWFRPNEQSNAIGNLVLHACGNARQWVLSGLAGHPDTRKRQLEFDQRDIIPKAHLLELLDATATALAQERARITTLNLLEKRPVQVYEESGIAILMHVAEHFSYHAGQITYALKWLKNLDTGYYPENLETNGNK